MHALHEGLEDGAYPAESVCALAREEGCAGLYVRAGRMIVAVSSSSNESFRARLILVPGRRGGLASRSAATRIVVLLGICRELCKIQRCAFLQLYQSARCLRVRTCDKQAAPLKERATMAPAATNQARLPACSSPCPRLKTDDPLYPELPHPPPLATSVGSHLLPAFPSKLVTDPNPPPTDPSATDQSERSPAGAATPLSCPPSSNRRTPTSSASPNAWIPFRSSKRRDSRFLASE